MGTTNYSDLLNQKAKKFYTDVSTHISKEIKIDDNNDNLDELSKKIQLKVSINQIQSGCSYQVKLFNINNNEKSQLNEYIDCISQDDKTTNLYVPIIMRYYFEKEQPLLVEVIIMKSDIKKEFQINTTLGCIMGSRKNTFQTNIDSTEKELLILQIEPLKQSEEVIKIKFDIKPTENISFKEIRYKMYYEIFSDIILYRSECLNNHGIFNYINIPLGLFKDNNITIIFYNSRRTSIGKFILPISEFTNKKSFNIKVNGTQFQILSNSIITRDFTFIDYLKAGIEIGLSVAIDFTNSNGYPKDKNSLHYIDGPTPNQYERAISLCGNIVAYYDYDQLFPCFGFGAKVNNRPRSLFNINFQKDPNIKYVEGIIKAYHDAINQVKFFGPTYFGPIIKNINNMIKIEDNNLKYHILMILTDGKIDDIEKTIDELVEGSFLPLSVIIIGIGKANFSSMKILDADENCLVNSEGKKAARDLVQFVPFLKYESNPEQMANEVLAEIPRQIIEYYELKNLDPIKLVN